MALTWRLSGHQNTVLQVFIFSLSLMIFYDISFLYQIFNSQYLHHLFPNYFERYEFPLTRRTPSHRSQTCLFFIFILFFSFLHDFFHFFMFTFFNQVLCFSTFLNLFFPHFSYFIFFTRCPSQTCLVSSFFTSLTFILLWGQST